MKRDKLSIIMVVLTLVGIALTSFLFFYTLQNKEAITQSIQKSVQIELAKYKLNDVKDLSIDDSKILLAVARYCEEHNDCAGVQGPVGGLGPIGPIGPIGLTGIGLNGYSPIKGIDYVDGKDGVNGYSPVKGVDYFDGNDGANGSDGRKIIQRCNSENNRVEWQYENDESWQPLYNLSPLQTCATEAQRR